jgi:hypothetical protein
MALPEILNGHSRGLCRRERGDSGGAAGQVAHVVDDVQAGNRELVARELCFSMEDKHIEKKKSNK